MKNKIVGIGSVIALLTFITLVWQIKDSFVAAEDFNKMSDKFEQLTVQQQELTVQQQGLNSRLDQHLQIERIQLIQQLEEKLEKLYIEYENNSNPATTAKIESTKAQLKVLYEQQ